MNNLLLNKTREFHIFEKIIKIFFIFILYFYFLKNYPNVIKKYFLKNSLHENLKFQLSRIEVIHQIIEKKLKVILNSIQSQSWSICANLKIIRNYIKYFFL